MKYTLAVCALLGLTEGAKTKMDINELTTQADTVLMQFEDQRSLRPLENNLLQQAEESESSDSSDSDSEDDELVA